MLDSFGNSLSALVAVGGNSSAARSARAKLQWRDRFGRFIEMGRGIKFKIRLGDGTARSVNGKFVGAVDGDTGQVFVQNDPSGLKDGFYDVKSGNAQEILATLDPDALAKRGITIGEDSNGNPVSDRADEEIPNITEIPFADAPIGWLRKEDKGGAQVWETDDGAYRMYHSYNFAGGKKTEQWGIEDVNRTPGKMQNWRDIGFALKSVDNSDKLPQPEEVENIANTETNPEPVAEIGEPQVDATDSAPVSDNNFDTDTFGVANDGFLIPTGKSTQDSTPEGFAAFVEANKPFLGEGGKRLILDVSPEGAITKIEIANSASTIDDAKAQAGGIGAPEFYDVAANASVPNDKNLNPTQETPNDPNGSTNSGESNPDDSRPDQPVDNERAPEGEPAPAAGDTSPEPASDALGQPIPADRAGLEQRLAYLNRAVGRVSPESPRFDDTFKAQKEVQDALDSFKEPEVKSPVSSPKEDATPSADAPEITTPVSGAPEDDKRIADLEKVVADLQADKTNNDILDKLDSIEKAVSDAPADPAAAPTPDAPEADAFAQGDWVQIKDAKGNIRVGQVSKPDETRPGNYIVRDKVERKGAPVSASYPAAELTAQGTPATLADLNGAPAGAVFAKADGTTVTKNADGSFSTSDGKNFAGADALSDSVYRGTIWASENSPAPAEPAQDNTPEVPNAPESVSEALPNPADMSWDDLAAELREQINPMSANLSEDLKRYKAVQEEFFGPRGGFAGRPDDTEPSEALPEPEAPATPAAPEIAPEAPPVASDEGDGLPENLADLEAMAGAMEREIAGARPARQRILREQVDKVYDKMDALAPPVVEPEPTPEPEQAPGVDAPEIAPDDVAEAFDNFQREEAAQIEKLRNILAGKDVTPEQESKMDTAEALDMAELDDFVRELQLAPNRPNTVTRPRPQDRNAAALAPATQNLIDIEADPDAIVDPNLIMADVRKNHPDFRELDNGDLVLESKESNGKTYELVVRRTSRERFFAYILETDGDGNQRASRLQVETHSYAALQTKIGRGKAYLREHPDLNKWMNRRQNKETLGQNGLQDNAAQDYINGTVIPRSEDQAYNQLVEGIAALAVENNAQRHFLDALANVGGQKPEFVDMVLESINNRKLLDAADQIAGTKESHLSVDGEKLAPGQWVDWTDDKQTRPVKDEYGNTVYETDAEGRFVLRPNGQKIALNEPNPDYGKVFRGQVKALRYKTNDGKYVYSDSTYVAFPELNARAGRNAQRQVARIGSQLKVVDGPDAPKNDAFFARKEEKRNQENVAGDFGLPNVAAAGSVRAPQRPAPTPPSDPAVRMNLENGVLHAEDFPEVAIPFDHIEAAAEVQDRDAVSKRASELLPGDYIVGKNENGLPVYDKVLSVTPNGDGRSRVKAVRINAEDHLLIDRVFPPNKLTVFPQPPVVEENKGVPEANKPVAEWAENDTVAIGDIPGGQGKIEKVMPGVNGDGADALFKIRGLEDGEVYWVEGSEVAQFGQTGDINPADPNAPAWHNHPATENQITALTRFIGNRQMNVAERGRLREAVANPNLTKKEASDLMNEFAPRKKVNAKSENLEELLERLNARNGNNELIDGIIGRMKQDQADPRVTDIYENEVVKKLTWKDIKANQFDNTKGLHSSELRVGDLVPAGVGADRYYKQVLGRNEGGGFRVRIITQRDGQIVRINGRQFVHGDIATSMNHRPLNVKRPNDKIVKNYFADPSMIPLGLDARAGMFQDALPEPEDPKMVDRMNERGNKLIEAYVNGHTVVARAEKGVDAERADIVEVAGGKRYFVKGVGDVEVKNWFGQVLLKWDGERSVNNEILANRIAQAIGIDDIQMGDYVHENGARVLVMDVVSGDIALNNPQKAQQILRNMWDYPNAWKMGLLDQIAVNGDRHDGNWMINEKGQPVPIDHGRVLFDNKYSPYSEFAKKLMRDISDGSAPISKAELLRIKSNLNMLRPEFASMGMTKEFIVMMDNISSIIGKATN